MRNYLLLVVFLGLLPPGLVYSREVIVKIGIWDKIESEILHKIRPFVVTIPQDYETSKQAYPVLYVLDGNEASLLQAILVTRKLGVEMILVAIPNTNRDRDIMPLSTPTYEVKNPGAENFLSFIGAELIPK